MDVSHFALGPDRLIWSDASTVHVASTAGEWPVEIARVELDSAERDVVGVATDGNYSYWLDCGLHRFTVADAPRKLGDWNCGLEGEGPRALTLSGGVVYLTVAEEWSFVHTASLDATGEATARLDVGGPLAIDDHLAVGAHSGRGPDEDLVAQTLPPGKTRVLVGSANWMSRVRIDGGDAYFDAAFSESESWHHAIWRVPLDGGTPTAIVDLEGHGFPGYGKTVDFAMASGTLFLVELAWTGEANVTRLESIGAGGRRTLATCATGSFGHDTQIDLDDRALYFLDGDSTLRRLDR